MPMEVVVGGGGGGEKLYSQNLRDFLRIEEDHRRNLNHSTSSSSGGGAGGGRRSSSGLTLSAVLGDKIGNPPPVEEPLRRVESNRTLLDIIREDQTAGLSLSLGRGREENRRSWRHLKDKIRLRRRGAAAAAPPATATPQRSFRFILSADSGESSQQNPIPLRNPRRSAESSSGRSEPPISPPRTQLNEIGSGERLIDAAEAAAAGASPEQPVRMSLMALLAENDRQMGYESSAYVTDEGETTGDDVASSSAAAGGGAGVEFENCCVCMVRHKGAAFIPCGHTFCRLCSRELWVQRGNCPLCNNFIVEVLDIF